MVGSPAGSDDDAGPRGPHRAAPHRAAPHRAAPDRAAGDHAVRARAGLNGAAPDESVPAGAAPDPAVLDRFALEWAFHQSVVPVAIHDAKLRFLHVSDTMRRLFGMPDGDLRGLRLTDVLADPDFAQVEKRMRQVVETGEVDQRQVRHRTRAGEPDRTWSITLSPVRRPADQRVIGVMASILDVTDQYWARRWLTLLNEAGARVGTTLDVPQTARELVGMFVPAIADFAHVDLVDGVYRGDEPPPGPLLAWSGASPKPSPGTVALRRVAHRAAGEAGPPPAVDVGELDSYPESSPIARCLATGRPVVGGTQDPDFLSWAARNPDRAIGVREFGVHSMMAVPLRARGTTLGVVSCLRHRPQPFSADELLLAEELAARAAVSIDNARRYTRERSTSLALQRSLLPRRLPEQSAVEVATRYLPADASAGVGGDWFDVIPLSGARVALVVGDVVGHGVYASATMGRLRTAVRTLADVDLAPDELLTHLDDLVAHLAAEAEHDDSGRPTSDLGATCLYAVYDPVSRRCTLARAGHPLPALLGPDGELDFLDLPAGPPLGLGGMPFESREVELAAGSLLVLYTDGLIEARGHDVDGGLAGLRRALAGGRAAVPPGSAVPLESACDAVLEALLPERPADDVALLLARPRALAADRVATLDLPPDPATVARAREWTVRHLAGWGLDELSFATELVVSELVTNAIRYGSPPIRLRLIRDRTLICEVSDGSSTAPHLRRARTFDEGGRGLLLVLQLTNRWGSRQTPTGKTIWTEQTIPAQTRGH